DDVIVLRDALRQVVVSACPTRRFVGKHCPDEIDDAVALEFFVDRAPLVAREVIEVAADEPAARKETAVARHAFELGVHGVAMLRENVLGDDAAEDAVAILGIGTMKLLEPLARISLATQAALLRAFVDCLDHGRKHDGLRPRAAQALDYS